MIDMSTFITVGFLYIKSLRKFNTLFWCPYTQLYIFLKDIGLEHYHDDIEIFVDTLDILIEAYSNQDELIEDIKEVIPEMKPAHRRLLWKGIEKFKFK